MEFKANEIVRVRAGLHIFSIDFALMDRGYYRILSTNMAGDYIHIDIGDGRNSGFFSYRFEKVDPNSLTKLEKIVYGL